MKELEPIRIIKHVINIPKAPYSPQRFVVLNRKPVFVYERKGGFLIAEDSGFYNCYGYERPSKGFEAFAGRKFKIPLKDGGHEEAHGQWWDCVHPEIKNKRVVCFGYNTEDELKKCFVFCGGSFDEDLLDTCTEEPIDYWEYEKQLRRNQ